MPLTLTSPMARAVVLTSPYCNPWPMTGENPVGGAPRPLPETLATMTPQAYNAIRYDESSPCGTTLKAVSLTCSSSTWGWASAAACGCSPDQSTSQAREIHFRPELFSYGDTG